MSKFHGRRDHNGEWQWEPGQAAARLRVFSAPLIIGAIVAMFMIAYVFAGNSFNFSPVLPNSCVSSAAAGADAQHDTTCTPCANSAAGDASAQNDDSAAGANVQWFGNPTCTPNPCESNANNVSTDHNKPECTPMPCSGQGDAGAQWSDGKTDTPTPPECTPMPCSSHGDVSAQWFDGKTDTPTPPECTPMPCPDQGNASAQWFDHTTDTPSPTPSCPPRVTPSPTPSPSPTPNPCPSDASAQWFDGHTDTPTPPSCQTETPSPTPTTPPTLPPTRTPGGSTETPTQPPTGTPVITPSPTPTTPPTHTPTNTPPPPPTNSPTPTPVVPTETPAPATETPTPVPATETSTPTPSPCPGTASAQWFDGSTDTPAPAEQCQTDLTLVKTDSPDPVDRGGTLTYSVTVTNVSDVDAENAIVTDTMPAGVTVISATPSQGSCTGTTCNLGTIPAGRAVGIAYVVTVNMDAPSLLTNMACVATSTQEKDMSNNCDDEDTSVPSATPTALPQTATPKVLPNTGGLPGAGGSDMRLVMGLGIGLLMAGAFATSVARRRTKPTI